MRATLQLETLKTLLKAQYGVPEGVTDQIDNIYRLTYREGYEDRKRDEVDEKEQRTGDEGI